jgi:hypothetical protein
MSERELNELMLVVVVVLVAILVGMVVWALR